MFRWLRRPKFPFYPTDPYVPPGFTDRTIWHDETMVLYKYDNKDIVVDVKEPDMTMANYGVLWTSHADLWEIKDWYVLHTYYKCVVS